MRFKERARVIFNDRISKKLDAGQKLKSISGELDVSHSCIKLILIEKTYPGLDLFCRFCVNEKIELNVLIEKKSQ